MDYPNNIPDNQQPLVTNTDLNSQNNLLNQPLVSQNNVQTYNPPLQNIPQPQSNMAPAPQQPNMYQPVSYVQPVVTSNQVIPNSVIITNPQNFKCVPVVCTCPNCKNTVTTIVTTNFNCLNCLCCLFFDLFLWIIFQIARNKDISCNDATHVCPHCQFVIFNYSAC